MITGTVVLDLSRDTETADRRAAGELYGLPDGVRVIVNVGTRVYWSPWTIAQLGQFVDRLHFDVQGSYTAVASWINALSDEGAPRAQWSA